MSLKERITEDIKTYMREKDTVSLNAVRMLKSDVKNTEIDTMKELDDAGIIKVVQSGIKKRKDSAEVYVKAGRQELADKELAEIKALEKYLPEQLGEEEIEALVKNTVAEMEQDSRKNFGMVMKAVMAKVSGRADGKTVSEVIKRVI